MDFRIGHLSTMYHTSTLMLARHDILGGFPARLRWCLYANGPAIIEAFTRGELDMAYIGLPPAIIGISRGLRVKCVSGGHVEGTVIASGINARGLPETSGLREVLSQFESIGIPGKGSIHDLIITEALRRNNLTAVKVKNMQWADQVLEAFIRGEVSAVAGTPALAQAVVEFGGGRVVYPPHLLWPDNPSCGIIAREDIIEDRGSIIKEFLSRHELASKHLRDKTSEASEDIAGFLGVVGSDFVFKTLKMSPRYCASLSEGYINCTMKLAAILEELNYITGPVRQDEIFDLSIIREIHPEPHHYR